MPAATRPGSASSARSSAWPNSSRPARSRLRPRPSFAGLAAVVHAEGSTAQQRPLAAAQLRKALRGARGHARTVLSTILHWGGSYARTNAHGDVSPGVAAWQAFKTAAQHIA